jgi:uncharacterized protein
MKIAGDYTFEAPRDLVWEALNDPDVLAQIMPGCEKLVQLGENEYEGALNIKVGPVQGVFQGLIKLTDISAPESYKMQVDGKGAPGFVKGVGGVILEAQGDTTLMHYDGDAQVGGRIASVGQRLIDSSAKSIIKQSLEGLHQYIKAKHAVVVAAKASAATAAADAISAEEAAAARQAAVAAAVAAVEPPKIAAPSQRQVATNVAKDVARDVVQDNRTLIYAVVAIIVIILLVWYFLS